MAKGYRTTLVIYNWLIFVLYMNKRPLKNRNVHHDFSDDPIILDNTRRVWTKGVFFFSHLIYPFHPQVMTCPHFMNTAPTPISDNLWPLVLSYGIGLTDTPVCWYGQGWGRRKENLPISALVCICVFFNFIFQIRSKWNRRRLVTITSVSRTVVDWLVASSEPL